MSARSPYVVSSLGHAVVLGLLLTVAALERAAPFVPMVRIVALPSGGRPGPKSVAAAPVVPVPQTPAEVSKPLPPPPKPEAKKERPPDKTPPPRAAAKVPDAKGVRPPEKPDVISKSRPLPAPKTPVAAAPSGAVETAAGDGALRPATRSDVGVEADGDPGPLTGYLGLLRDKVEANWEPPATLGQHGAVRAVIAFEISRAGGGPLPNSMQVRVTSGQPAFDRAAQRAVLNAAPFAPLPAGWGTDSIGIRFTFSGEY